MRTSQATLYSNNNLARKAGFEDDCFLSHFQFRPQNKNASFIFCYLLAKGTHDMSKSKSNCVYNSTILLVLDNRCWGADSTSTSFPPAEREKSKLRSTCKSSNAHD